MVAECLEVRLDPERRRRLQEILAARGVSVSEAIRGMIDDAYNKLQKEARARAARELAELEIEDVPNPDALSAQIEGKYDLGHLR